MSLQRCHNSTISKYTRLDFMYIANMGYVLIKRGWQERDYIFKKSLAYILRKVEKI